MFGRLALESTQDREAGFLSSDLALDNLKGQHGIAKTILRPAGKIIIGDNVYDATAASGYIEKGEKIRVIRHESSQLFVKKRK
jgi:membrane-bound serine protease (ClpP class)